MTQRPKKLLDQARDAIRLKHYAYSTQKTYVTGPSALFPSTQPHGTCAPKNHTTHPDMSAGHPSTTPVLAPSPYLRPMGAGVRLVDEAKDAMLVLCAL
jgi:hypothetical protein